ncbi:MAG: cation:proton antiporter [Verrucomicrobiae bacterium]
MQGSGVILNLGWMILGAALFGVLARMVRLPSIVGYLVAGLLLGPATGAIVLTPAINEISDMGIVLLLFLVGLELTIARIRDVGKVAVAGGLAQIALTGAGGYALCHVLGFGALESLFLAFALTISSTVVVVKVLTDKGELDSLHGRIAVGIFLIQDLVVLVALTLLSGFSPRQGLDIAGVAANLLKALGGMAVLLGGVLAASRHALPRPFAWASGSQATLFIWSLGWCFLVVAAARFGNLSVELGAFFAGLSLAQLPYTHDLQHRIKPLMSLFVAVFFVSLGVRMAPGEIGSVIGTALVLSAFVLAGKAVIFLTIISRFGYGERTGFQASVAIAQISEFSFILVGAAAASGLVGGRVVTVTALVGIITIAVSSYMILYSGPLYRLCHRLGILRIFQAPQNEDGGPEMALPGQVIVIGMNTLGRRIAETLHRRGEIVLAIDTDPRKLRGLPCRTLHGNIEYRAVLEEQGFAHAKLVVSALQIEDTNDLLAYRCKEAGVPCCIHAVDLSVMENLLAHDVAYFMLPKVDAVKYQSALLRERGLLGENPQPG